jgi:hypothetical protein
MCHVNLRKLCLWVSGCASNRFRGAACSKGPAASSGGSRGLVERSRAGGGGGGGGGGASESKGSPAPAPAPQTKGMREWRPCVACRVCSSACVLSCSRGWSRTVQFGVLRGFIGSSDSSASLSGNISPILLLCLVSLGFFSHSSAVS